MGRYEDDNFKLYIDKVDKAVAEMCETLRVGDDFINPRSRTMRDWFYVKEMSSSRHTLSDKVYFYKNERESERSLNVLLGYALNKHDYVAVMNILNKPIYDNINYEEASLGINAFISAMESREFRISLNLDRVPKLRDVVNKLSMFSKSTKHLPYIDRAFLSTVLINDEIKNADVLQNFSQLTTAFMKTFRGNLPSETMESFKNYFKRHDASLSSVSLPTPLEENLEKKVKVLSDEIIKLSGRLKGAALSIDCLVDLQEVAKELKAFDQKTNLGVIKNRYDKVSNVFVPGSSYHDLLNDIVGPNVQKTLGVKEKIMLDEIRKSVVLFLKLVSNFEMKTNEERDFLKDCKKIHGIKTDDSVKSQIALGYLRDFKKNGLENYNKVLGAVLEKMEDFCVNSKELSPLEIEGYLAEGKIIR